MRRLPLAVLLLVLVGLLASSRGRRAAADTPPDYVRDYYHPPFPHAPPYPRDEQMATPPWLYYRADGARQPDRVVHIVLPQQADPTVQNFLNRNVAMFDRSASRGELLVYLPGTGGNALEAGLFLSAAADAGYHVIGLQYNTLPPGTAFCETAHDPDCFARFREKRSWGDDATGAISDLPQEAIVTRLVRLLETLAQDHPAEEWQQYLVNGTPNWPVIALTGQSQGAGMAAFIAKRVALARVILSSSPWDHASPSGRLAPWLSEASATPPERWFGVYHGKEHMAGMLARAYAALGVPDRHIRVLDIVPNPPPPPHPVVDRYHGTEWGATVPVDAGWRPTVTAIWAFMLGHGAPGG
jgi:hypothetical protein